MTIRIYKYLLTCGLMLFSLLPVSRAGDPISDTAKILREELGKVNKAVANLHTDLDTNVKNINKALSQLKENKAVVSANDSASALNAWKFYEKHPESLYENRIKGNILNLPLTISLVIFLLFFVLKSFYYFKNTSLCRDESYYTDPADGTIKLRPEKERPYSFSRVQMFWWTIIIISCYGAFYAMFGKLIPLNPTCVLLLGGSMAVQIFGKTIDTAQKENDAKKEVSKSAEGNTISKELPARHQDLNSTKGLLTDILSDENGISMHRLQSVAFNVIYGIGFLVYFITSISTGSSPRVYPFINFEGWQFALLGVSAVGYLGLKSTENGKSSEPERLKAAVEQSTKAKMQAGIMNDKATAFSENNTETAGVKRDLKNYQ